jgi:uncharacterized membrane protein
MDEWQIDIEQRVTDLESQTAFSDFRRGAISKRTVVAIAFSIMLGVCNSFLRSASTSLVERLRQYIFLEDKMDIFTMIRPDFVTIALFLWILGAILKYRTNLMNGKIPVILFAVSFVLCSAWGYATSEYTGSVQIVDALLMCGLVHGVIVTAIAAYGWDVVNGIKKTKKGGRI